MALSPGRGAQAGGRSGARADQDFSPGAMSRSARRIPYRNPEQRPRDLLNSTRVPSKPVELARDHHSGGPWPGASAMFADHEWALRGFTNAEKDVWLAAGLRDGQAKLAVQLIEAGLSPQDLSADLGGWTVLERVHQGEDVVALARLHERKHGQDAG